MRNVFHALAIVSLAAFLLFPQHTNAQITFERSYGGQDDEFSISGWQCSDGGYIMSAATKSFGYANEDILIVRTDAVGDTLWTRTYGGPWDDESSMIRQCSDGGFIMVGVDDFDPVGKFSGIYVLRLNPMGDTLWTAIYGGDSLEMPKDVQQCYDQGFIITGLSTSFDSINDVTFLLKIDANGDTLWNRYYNFWQNSQGRSLAQLPDSGFVVTGSVQDSLGGVDVFLLRTDAWGDTVWVRRYDGTLDEVGRSVALCNDSGFIITGNTNSFGGPDEDVFIIKTYPDGWINWSLAYGGSGDEQGKWIKQCPDSGFIVTGYTNSFGSGGQDIFLLRLDPWGDTLWSARYGGTGNDIGKTVQLCSDGGFVISGSTTSYGSGFGDIYLIKTDAEGHTACNFVNAPMNQITASTYEDYAYPYDDWGLYMYHDSTWAGHAALYDTSMCFGCATAVPICMVTVDNSSTRNVVVWAKPVTTDIDSFRIYRDISGNYTYIGSVSYDSLSLFIDSSAGINPNITSYRYKISVIDTCGLESDTGDAHETIHLTTNQGTNGEINLIWDAYVGFQFARYRILRDSTGTGNYQVIDSVSATNFTYTDWNPPTTPVVNYIVEVIPPEVCVATRAQSYNSSRSNRSDGLNNDVGEYQQSTGWYLYPNPATGVIHIAGNDAEKLIGIRCFNLLGKQMSGDRIINGTGNQNNIDISAFAPGHYVMQLIAVSGVEVLPFVVR